MKLSILVCGIALACALAFSTDRVLCQGKQEKAKNESKQPAEMQEMMKKWAELARPGENHKVLDAMTGRWETATRVWWEGPQKSPVETKGAAEIKWIMDGRYLLEESTGQTMGQSYKSMTLTGFDNFKKKYLFSYVDSMGTAIYTGEGTFDPAARVLISYGKVDDLMTGERDKPVKYVTRLLGKDKYVFEIYDLIGGPSEFKAVEITYTRKQ
jgi:hypothetical protein